MSESHICCSSAFIEQWTTMNDSNVDETRLRLATLGTSSTSLSLPRS